MVCVRVCEGMWWGVYVKACNGMCVCVCCVCGYIHMGVDAHAFVYHIEPEEDIDCPALSLSTLFIWDMNLLMN